MSDIAIRGATNGGPTIADVLEAIRASHKDSQRAVGRVASHLESEQGHVDKILKDHFSEASSRDERIRKLEATAAACPGVLDQHKSSVLEAHYDFHNKYVASVAGQQLVQVRRASDPPGEDHESDRRTYLMWVIGSKVSYIAFAALIVLVTVAINYVVYGRP